MPNDREAQGKAESTEPLPCPSPESLPKSSPCYDIDIIDDDEMALPLQNVTVTIVTVTQTCSKPNGQICQRRHQHQSLLMAAMSTFCTETETVMGCILLLCGLQIEEEAINIGIGMYLLFAAGYESILKLN